MIDAPLLDLLGWIGFAGLMIFYWKIGSGRTVSAYVWSILGALGFFGVGLASLFGYAAHLPSLVVTEGAIILLNFRALWKVRNENTYRNATH